MGKIFASGVFDRLHNGHLYYLKESKKLGDYLVVCVASDRTARKNGKSPVINQEQRRELVATLSFVDEAFVGKDLNGNWTIYDTLKKIRPDTVTLGWDQKFDEKEIEEGCRKRGLGVKVVRIGKLGGVNKRK